LRVAILISGYLRTFNNTYQDFKEKVIDKFDDVDIYLHMTKNEEKEDKYLNSAHDPKNIINLLNPICFLYEENFTFSSKPSLNNTINTWFKYYKLNNIKKINENEFGKYDLVLKWRPDVSLDSELPISNDGIVIPSDSKIDKSKLENPNDDYICDILAWGPSDLMDEYFDFYKSINDLHESKKTSVSETLLHHYLKESKLPIVYSDFFYSVLLSKCNVFAITGDSGSGKTTLSNLLMNYFSNPFTLECDRYHKWERGDENWKTLTHLNPEANFLSKMSEDIFDLKIGKSIFQVDYDHKNGKFTQPQKIEKADNIIVCGLHSLYNEDNSIYNLKIFIDTDPKLKFSWKLKRDQQKRGYTKEQVLSQIESRKEDFEKYILPQKKLSDLIINFYIDDEVHENLKLNIYISKRFNSQKISNHFKRQKIKFDTESKNSDFTCLCFHTYQEHNLSLNNKTNTYYDYIIFTILNLK
jgi:uridine kinase